MAVHPLFLSESTAVGSPIPRLVPSMPELGRVADADAQVAIAQPLDAFEATLVQPMSSSLQAPSIHADDMAGRLSDDTSLHAVPTIGHVGRYALKYKLGQGGLGTVYAALDPLLARPIALKTLRVDASQGQRDAFEAMLLAEARAAAGLNHPNIVTVFDAGLSEDGVYLAMEKLDGEDLKQRLAGGWRADAATAATLVSRVAQALEHAHRQGVVHCDIKPANIFMVDDASPKVVDFGIARVAHAAGVDIPLQPLPADALSPYYAAPEQLMGGVVDARSDVYALGVVLYELLTGTRPYRGNTLDELKHAVIAGRAATAHSRSSRVPTALSDIARKAMAVDPAERHGSAAHLAEALQCWVATTDGASRRRRRRIRPLAAGAALAFVMFFVWLGGDGGGRVDVAMPRAAAPSPSAVLPSGLGWALPDVGGASGNAASSFVQPARLSALAAGPGRMAADDSTSRSARPLAARASTRSVAAPPRGTVQLAVTPWGHIEVNGRAAGLTPPLQSLSLPPGDHTIVIRNADFAAHRVTVTVGPDRNAVVRHRFGS